MAEFFVPFTSTPQEQEAVYTALRKTAAEYLEPRPVSDRRLSGVCLLTEGEEQWILVGKPYAALGERVMAIFEAQGEDGPVLVLTPSHGVWRGDPHPLPAQYLGGTREFRG